MGALNNEELNEILGRINKWIENCDSKVSHILAGIGALAGIVLATDYLSKIISIFYTACKNIGAWTIIYLLFFAFSLGLVIYGVFMLISVLFARVNIETFKAKGLKTDSLLFFSSIAKNKSFLEYRNKVNVCSAEQLKDDLISQIYICSLICDKKFELYKKGLLAVIVGFNVFVLVIVIGLVAF